MATFPDLREVFKSSECEGLDFDKLDFYVTQAILRIILNRLNEHTGPEGEGA